jgi:hypothetical protein
MVVLIVCAKLAADALFPGIYQWQIVDAGYPMLEALEGLNAAERAAAVHCQVGLIRGDMFGVLSWHRAAAVQATCILVELCTLGLHLLP